MFFKPSPYSSAPGDCVVMCRIPKYHAAPVRYPLSFSNPSAMLRINSERNLSYPDHDRIGKISRCVRDDIRGHDRPEDEKQPTHRGFFSRT